MCTTSWVCHKEKRKLCRRRKQCWLCSRSYSFKLAVFFQPGCSPTVVDRLSRETPPSPLRQVVVDKIVASRPIPAFRATTVMIKT